MGVRTGTRRSNIHFVACRAVRVLWFRLLWGPLVRGIVLECCSLPRRIGTISSAKVYQRGVSYGLVGPCENQRAATLAYIRDTQRITNCYQRATLLDVKLIVKEWRMGVESAIVSGGIHPPCNLVI